MAINKVVFGNDTLIDLTEDSVNASNLLEGETAHDRSGASITGTAKQGHVIQNASGTDLTQRAKLQFSGVSSRVTDDSTNGKTVVNVDPVPIEYTDWLALSQSERDAVYWLVLNAPDVDINIANEQVAFTEAQTRENIASGETVATIFGKIKKWFSDLASMFVSKSGDTMSGNLYINRQDGTASAIGTSQINLGNSIAEGTNKNSYGRMAIFGKGSAFTFLQATNITANRVHELPDKSGTLAIEGDIFKRTTWDGTSGSGITFSNVTYMAGGYIHIGNLVHFEYRMAVTSALTANVDYTLISGLPAQFSSANVTAFDARCGRSLLIAYMLASDSTIQCTPTYNVPVNSIIVISGTYFANTYKA